MRCVLWVFFCFLFLCDFWHYSTSWKTVKLAGTFWNTKLPAASIQDRNLFITTLRMIPCGVKSVSCRWWTIPSSQAVWITPGEECVWELRLQAGCEDSEMTLALSSHHLLRRLAFHPAPWIQAHEGMCVSAAFFPVPYTCVLLCLQHSEACYQAPRDGSAGRPATQRAHRHYWDAELPTTGKWGRNLVV